MTKKRRDDSSRQAKSRGPNYDPEPPLSARGTKEEGRTNMGRNARSRTEKYGQ